VVDVGFFGGEGPVVTVMRVVRRERLSHYGLLAGGDARQKSLAGGVLGIERERLLRSVLSAGHMSGGHFGLSQMAQQVRGGTFSLGGLRKHAGRVVMARECSERESLHVEYLLRRVAGWVAVGERLERDQGLLRLIGLAIGLGHQDRDLEVVGSIAQGALKIG
jgi:hypothetical protein